MAFEIEPVENILPPSPEAKQLIRTIGKAARGQGAIPLYSQFDSPVISQETGLPLLSHARLKDEDGSDAHKYVYIDTFARGNPDESAGTGLDIVTQTPKGKLITSSISYVYDRAKDPIPGRFARTKAIRPTVFTDPVLETNTMTPRQIRAADRLARLRFGLNANDD